MRPSCPSSQVTANGRPLIVRLTCPKSSPFPQNATDLGERPIDPRRDLAGDRFQLGVGLAPLGCSKIGPSRLGRELEPCHSLRKPLDGIFERAHLGRG